MQKIYLLFAILTCYPVLAVEHPPTPVKQVDLPRYMGTWYEIARLPMPYQKQCKDDISATYSLNQDASVTVVNRCRTADGSYDRVKGRATSDNDSANRLHVTFLPAWLRWLPIGKAPYWILRLDKNYRYALVGTPDRKYLWILSRTPQIDSTTYQNYLKTAQQQGYNTSNIIRNPGTKKPAPTQQHITPANIPVQ